MCINPLGFLLSFETVHQFTETLAKVRGHVCVKLRGLSCIELRDELHTAQPNSNPIIMRRESSGLYSLNSICGSIALETTFFNCSWDGLDDVIGMPFWLEGDPIYYLFDADGFNPERNLEVLELVAMQREWTADSLRPDEEIVLVRSIICTPE